MNTRASVGAPRARAGQTDDFLDLVLGTLTHRVYVVDEAGRILYANLTAAKTLGLGRREIQGMQLRDVPGRPTDLLKKVDAMIEAAFETGRRKREVLRVPESTGLRDIDVVMTPVFAPDAKTVRFVTIVAIDVTCDETDLATGASRARPGDDRLSERRRQVLTRVAQGCSNREIATELGISVRTVESHRQHVAKQLGVSSRADFFRYASEHGYV